MNEKISYLPADNEEKAVWTRTRGPWNDEPDRVEWRDEETKLPCIALRVPWSGHWCGYVGVGPDHRLHGKDYDHESVNVEVHGGLTFASACQEPNPKQGDHRVCHTPEAGEPDHAWWFGFDCAHSGDMSPSDEARARRGAAMCYRDGYYKPLDFVKSECASLARQLAEVHSLP
jgi:hypothetical protein